MRTKGFSSDEFTNSASWAAVTTAQRVDGLPDDEIAVLIGALRSAPYANAGSTDDIDDIPGPLSRISIVKGRESNETISAKHKSVLWDNDGGIGLPNGNFPNLLAVTLGLLRRPHRDYNRWLEILDRHLDHHERCNVWIAMLRHLPHLAGADRKRAQTFLGKLLRKFPQAFETIEGARFVGTAQWWFPNDLFAKYLEILDHSEWPLSQRALGELLVLRTALIPDDQNAKSRFDLVMQNIKHNQGDLQQGLVRSAAELWAEDKFRAKSHEVLMAAVLEAEGEFARSINFAFVIRGKDHKPSHDEYASELLDAILSNPKVLSPAHVDDLVEYLEQMLADTHSPDQIAKVALALLDTIGNELDGRLSTSTDKMMSIALTLQRFESAREAGTTIFERLVISNLYGIEDVVRKHDQRF